MTTPTDPATDRATDRTAGKAPNPSAVSRTLAKAGLERAEAETTSVRGYYRYSPGYIVRGAKAAWEDSLTDDRNDPAVFVTCQTINDYPDAERRTSAEVIADLVPQYQVALQAAGYDVEQVADRLGLFKTLRVTRRVED